jgi:predicted porin
MKMTLSLTAAAGRHLQRAAGRARQRFALALAAVAACAAGGAHAQSTVTLFGVVDANLRHVKNGDTKVNQLGTDGLSSSRLGFRGTEDLGGGLTAGFWLEAALNPDDGSTRPKFWHRRTTVSLSGGFGEVRLGRDFTPTYTGLGDFDAFGDNGIGSFSKVQSSLTATVNTNTRADNEVSYFLPKGLGGVYGQVSVAAGEGTVGNKYIGARLGYAAGPLNVSGSYGTTEASAGEDKYKIGNLGAAYDFGVVRVLGAVSQMKFIDRKEDLLLIGATVPVGSGLLRASVARANLSGGTTATATADADDATLVALGYTHSLSKRTALYTTVASINNKGAQRFSVGTTTPALAAGQKSSGLELGLRHSF